MSASLASAIMKAREEGLDLMAASLVSRDGMDDVADGDADGVACAAFLFKDFSAAVFRALENGVLDAGRAVGEAGEKETVDSRGGPDGEHGVAVLAEDERLDLRGREFQLF